MAISELAIQTYVLRYRNKATVLRKIHSDQANSRRSSDLWHTVVTIAAGALITFFGFTGTDRLLEWVAGFSHSTLPSVAPAASASIGGATAAAAGGWLAKPTFEFFFNLAVLALFVTSLLNLIFRWKEEYVAHFQGVVNLTRFINWLDELRLTGIEPRDLSTIKEIRSRYQGIVEALPPNSDADYTKAKNELNQRTTTSAPHAEADSETPPDDPGTLFTLDIVRGSGLLMSVLRAMRSVNGQLWLGGGAIRNCVWDSLTGRTTLHDDFDIVYFDAGDISQSAEQALEDKVSILLPKVLRISVKNQARMHLVNSEPQRDSLIDAVGNWPETATSIAVRLIDADKLDLIAPHGLDDLMGLVVRPTAYHQTHDEAFKKRIHTKDWRKNWPEVQVIEPSA